MARSFAVSLFASAALTLVLFKLLDRRRGAEPAPAQAADSKVDAPAAPAADPAAELARVVAENDQLKKDLEAAIAASKKEAAAETAKAEAAKNPWGKLAKQLMDYLARVKKDPASATKNDSQSMWIEMMGLMGKIAKQYGVPLDEAMLTPDGMPALVLAALENADPPLTDAERESLLAAADKAKSTWDELQKGRDSRTRLESRLAMMQAGAELGGSFRSALSPEHAELAGQMQAMSFGLTGALGTGFYSSNGTHEKIVDDFSKQWAKVMKLDASQASTLAPIVDDYLKACSQAEADWQKAIASGAKNAEDAMMTGKIRAQIAAQKRIAETLTLTAAQKKALDGWATTYMFHETEAESK